MSVKKVTRSSVPVMESICKDPVESEPHGEVVMETPESDSDSGNSLFLTQSVTTASRNVRRRRPSRTTETKGKSAKKTATETCSQATEDHVSDPETDLLPRRKKTNSRQPRIRRRIKPAKKMDLPFLKTSGSRQLYVYKNQMITNSETGGFFKCVLKLNSGHERRRKRRELSPSILTTESEPNSMEEGEDDDDDDDDEDIRKVDIDCFILSTHESNQQNWLPSQKWKRDKRSEESNNCQEEQERCSQTKKVVEDIMEPQEDTDLDTEGRSKSEKSRKPPASPFVSPHCSSSSLILSADNSPFVQSLFVDHQEEHCQIKPQVLVSCSQSQYPDRHADFPLDWPETQTIGKAFAVEETQWACLTEQDDDETQILEDREKDGLDEQVQDENICDGVHQEPVENEDFSSVGGSFSCSQDLFQEPNDQESSFTEISVDKDNEDLTKHMLANVAGSRENDYLSPVKDIPMVRQEEKTESPLFIYDGLKFLKRKKCKNKKDTQISVNLKIIQTDPGQNGDSPPPCNDTDKPAERKKVKKNVVLEEPVETFPEISLSAQDSSEVSAAVGKNKPKKKRKKDKKSELEPQEDHWINVEEAIGIPTQATVSLAEETQQPTRTDLPIPSIAQEVKHPDISTSAKDLVQSVCHDPQRKKKKKAKERVSSPLMSDEMVAPQCSEESHSSHGVQTVKKKKQKSKKNYVGEEQVGELATGSRNLEEPLEKSTEIPASIEIQPENNVDLKTNDSVTPRKKKKRKRQEVEDTVNVEAPSIETVEQVETPHMVQDSEQQAAEEDQVKKIKKKKKKKDRTHQEDHEHKNPSVSLGIGLGDRTASDTLSMRNEFGGTAEEEGLGGAEPVKKKKKKMKELENNGSGSVSHGLVSHDLDDSRWHNAEVTTVGKETSRSIEKFKESPAPCLEMQVRNDTNEMKKCKRSKGGSSESIQDVLQLEDTVQSREKKKKKKRQADTDLELYPVKLAPCQESGSPLEPSETITEKKKKKKKKNKKDPVDRVENEGLDVVPELTDTEQPNDIVVTCHAKKDSILFPESELLINIKKKKKKKKSVKDSE